MSLKKLIGQLTDGRLNDKDKNFKIEEYLKNYEIKLIKENVKKRFNLKNGIIDDVTRPEPFIKDREIQTELSNSKILSDDLKILWKNVESAKIEQETKLAILKAKFAETDQQIQRVNKLCGDYQLLWKIRSFDQVMQDVKDGKKTTVQSPVFDTHRNGYKMQLSLCPYGEAQNTHMSLFCSILKGTSDSFLPWPFNCPISFTLLNQKLEKKVNAHVNLVNVNQKQNSSSTSSSSNINEFKDHSLLFQPSSDPNNEIYLQRPVDDRNKSLGFPKFISLEDLQTGGYIENNTIYIRVLVDISKV